MILNSSNPYYNSILGKIEQVCSVMQIMQIAYVTGFIKRTRDFRPEMLLLAMFLMLDRSRSISFEPPDLPPSLSQAGEQRAI